MDLPFIAGGEGELGKINQIFNRVHYAVPQKHVTGLDCAWSQIKIINTAYHQISHAHS